MAQALKRFRYRFTLTDGHVIEGVVKTTDKDAAWRAAAGLRAQLVTNTMVEEAEAAPPPAHDGTFPDHLGK